MYERNIDDDYDDEHDHDYGDEDDNDGIERTKGKKGERVIALIREVHFI